MSWSLPAESLALKQVAVISTLVEGSGNNETCRMTGVSKPTVWELMAEVGKAALRIATPMFAMVLPSGSGKVCSSVSAKRKNSQAGAVEGAFR